MGNGICLSRIHHRAFEASLIGVTPDYRIQVSKRRMEMQDGVLLEGGLKALHERALVLPDNQQAGPSRELLEMGFNEFKGWGWPGHNAAFFCSELARQGRCSRP